MPLSSRQRFLVRCTLVVFAVLGVVAGLVVLGACPPTGGSFYPKCMSYSLAGIHCPGCGLTRAAHAALNGRFGEAASQNVLVFWLVPYMLLYVSGSLWRYLWQTPPRSSWFRWPNWLTYLVLGLLLMFAVARNIPVYPLTLLAPHELVSPPADPTP
jgi:hypothetical protein